MKSLRMIGGWKHRIAPLVAALFGVSAALADIDFAKLSQETAQSHRDSKEFVFVWWIPTAILEVAMKAGLRSSEAERNKILKLVDGYTIFAVAHFRFGTHGEVAVMSREDLMETSVFRVGNQVVPPEDEALMPYTVFQAINLLRPLTSQLVGGVDQGYHFIVYPNRKAGKPMISPDQAGRFEYSVGGRDFRWKLPLGSVLPPMVDPITGEVFPGNYRYNPFTGGELRKQGGIAPRWSPLRPAFRDVQP
ncbi:MAG TPA: hypothetical protein PLS03_14450 [Terrimicrobiaceae bacterium]|nr:hypothetical protein [Terrimicrobiaceae bacterium]